MTIVRLLTSFSRWLWAKYYTRVQSRQLSKSTTQCASKKVPPHHSTANEIWSTSSGTLRALLHEWVCRSVHSVRCTIISRERESMHSHYSNTQSCHLVYFVHTTISLDSMMHWLDISPSFPSSIWAVAFYVDRIAGLCIQQMVYIKTFILSGSVVATSYFGSVMCLKNGKRSSSISTFQPLCSLMQSALFSTFPAIKLRWSFICLKDFHIILP